MQETSVVRRPGSSRPSPGDAFVLASRRCAQQEGVPRGRTRVLPRASQRSQALIEFALVSPVLLLLLFGIIDIGRAIFYYDTLNHAAREGARVAIRASNQLPTNNDVLNAVNAQMQGVPVTAPCPQGPVTGATPPSNSAWLYITEPSPPSTVETSPLPNAPGGEYPAIAQGSCSAVNPAGGHQQLQVTLRFNLVLITPVVAQATADHIVITAAAVFRTEY
jgi:TadE-like protein